MLLEQVSLSSMLVLLLLDSHLVGMVSLLFRQLLVLYRGEDLVLVDVVHLSLGVFYARLPHPLLIVAQANLLEVLIVVEHLPECDIPSSFILLELDAGIILDRHEVLLVFFSLRLQLLEIFKVLCIP